MLLERLNKNDPGEEESSIFKFGDEILMLCATIEIFTFIDTFTNTEAAAMYLSICIILWRNLIREDISSSTKK